MKKIYLPVLCAVLLLFACTLEVGKNDLVGSGTPASEERAVADVTAVELNLQGNLTIALGDAESLAIDSEDNLLPYLETRVRNGTLEISAKAGTNIRPTLPLAFRLTVKSLKALTVNSSGDIAAPFVETDAFTINSNSSGYILLAGLNADRLTVVLNSSGAVTVSSGRVEDQNVTINSSGKYTAESVRTTDAEVLVNSSGKAILWVTETLKAELNSSGNVEYYGAPAVTESNQSSGRLISLGEK
jgi:hypothetical protein